PPLYRLTQGEVTHYARDDAHREELLQTAFNGRGKVEISRFKGLGEMPARYLRATTMDPAQRTLLRVKLPERADPAALESVDEGFERTEKLVETLMGRRPEYQMELLRVATGTVKWFNSQKGYGFIQPTTGGADVFVHISAVERAGMDGLNEGQKLTYELEQGQRGRVSAVNLRPA